MEPTPSPGDGTWPAEGPPPLSAWYPPDELARIEGWSPPDVAGAAPIPSRLVAWGRGSVVGAVLTGAALGLREVLDPPRDEQIVVEVDASGDPHDLPIRLLLDPDDPGGSLCIVRRDPPPPVV